MNNTLIQTEKSQATELVEKFSVELKEHKGCYDFETAKQCALICVNEIFINNVEHDESMDKLWWKEVKKEIEKL